MILINELVKSGQKHEFLKKVVQKTLRAAGFKKKSFVISIYFVTAKEIKNLNRRWRGKNKATDVLSFSQYEGKTLVLPKSAPLNLGDIFICIKVAQKQAEQLGHGLKREVAILLIHGVLHLLGYDHIKQADFKKMNALEIKTLKSL